MSDLRVRDYADVIDDAVEFVVAAGSDPAAYANTFMPPHPTVVEARAWLDTFPKRAWLGYDHGEPVLMLIVHGSYSTDLPDGYLETGTYVVPDHRGQGIAAQAWAMVEPELSHQCSGLAGVTWENNVAAQRRLEKSGFTMTSRVWFDAKSPDELSGWCCVWAKPLP